jgi:aspartate 1-decarboxylase
VTIDPVLLEATGMVVNEKVLVADCENGARFETYSFEGRHGSGEVIINGAAANLTGINHQVLIMSFCQLTEQELRTHRPKVVICDADNGIAELLEYGPVSTASE